MRPFRLCILWSLFAASVNAADEKPFMSFFNPPAKPIPLEEHRSYESAVMQTKVGYNIYLPPGYHETGNNNRYPVIYWLHGRGCSESNDQFPVATVDAAIRSNAVPPLIFVYASGGGMSFYSDSVDGKWMAETTIIKELIPHIDTTYRTIPNRDGRAIQGMSMGGFGALKLALKQPELFSSVVAFAGGYRSAQGIQADEISRQILERVFANDPERFMANHPARIAEANVEAIRGRVAIKMLVGLDDYLLENNRSMHAKLTELNLPHQYWEIPGIKHDLPRLSAWLATDGLQFAASQFNLNSTKAVQTAALQPQSGELCAAAECRERERLPNFFAKLRRGSQVRIAYLGGSITAQEGWRPKSLNWFREQFPGAKISEINAAIGGTGSDLGVFRLRHDVLQHQPDLLFVEFAVNDAGAPVEQIYRCIEGIVRQTWRNDPTTDICFVYTLAGNMLQTLQEGRFPRSATAMEKVADHYGIPSIHLGLEVARLEEMGKLSFRAAKPKTEAEQAALGGKILFSPDGVHPYTDTGHQLYLEAIVRSMPEIGKAGREKPHALGAPLVSDNWEAAKMIPLNHAKLSEGWLPLDPLTNSLAKSFTRRLPELWKADEPGESLSLRFRGTTLRIYDLVGPECGQVSVVLDEGQPVVKPRFDAYCTYHRLATLSIAEGLPDAVHTVKVTVLREQPDKAKILGQRGEKIDDPKRFDGTTWYAGALLLIGDLVE